MLYTLVDPDPGYEVAYNRWYERDHFYAGCLVGPWLFSGKRWVATRELKDMRFPADSVVTSPVDRGSYLAIYWVHEARHDEHFAWGAQQVRSLYEDGRGFSNRRHAHTLLCNSPWAHYRDDDPVPIELALDHGYAGLANVFTERADGVTRTELVDFLNDQALPDLLRVDSPVVSCVSWQPITRDPETDGNAPMDLGSGTGGEERLIQLFFLETHPRECWDRFVAYAAAVNDSGLARVILAAPFIPTIVGTDTYTDQLW